MITVLPVDDHVIIQKTLQYLIEKSDDIQVLATASNGIEATRQILVHSGAHSPRKFRL